MSVNYGSKAGFGRRAGAVRTPIRAADRAEQPVKGMGQIAPLIGLAGLLLVVIIATVRILPDFASINADTAQIEDKVIAIVNQPITHLPRSQPFGLFTAGWFHDGATKPNFNTVDVRASQELIYKDYVYVTSNLNPTEMFIASELEFNAMTKYFYVDRSLPKKRLSEAEMVEINRLYRLIGEDERALELKWMTVAGLFALGVGSVATMVFLILRSRQPQPS
jgi:hypothetical protein